MKLIKYFKYCIIRDVLGRWVYPFVPDTGFLDKTQETTYTFNRGHKYLPLNFSVPNSTKIGDLVYIGKNTKIGINTINSLIIVTFDNLGDNCEILESVIGDNCIIEDGVKVTGSYIENNVFIGRKAELTSSLICDGAVVHSEATLEPGCILSFNVIISASHHVPENARITLCPEFKQKVSIIITIKY